MPVGTPPLGGPVGRSRMRISASGLVSWQRCPRQWFHRTKQGLSGPVNPEMILGIIVEEAMVGLLMEDPGHQALDATPSWVAHRRGQSLKTTQDVEEPESLAEIKEYLLARVSASAELVIELGAEEWAKAPFKRADREWSEITQEKVEELLKAGIEFQATEVKACFEAEGGPHLDRWRADGDPHFVTAPRWSGEPRFPIPDKVPGHSLKLALNNVEEASKNSPEGEVGWAEAWRIARPWVKDPRVWQPQRLYHPDGWAAGELDLLLRWDGKARVVDIKSGDGSSGWSAGLAAQLRFYQWLYLRTRADEPLVSEVSGLEGWYLGSSTLVEVEPWSEEELEQKDEELHSIWEQMTAADGDSSTWPVAEPASWKDEGPEETCRRCHARFICSEVSDELRKDGLDSFLPDRMAGLSRDEIVERLQPREPASPISAIPSRLNVSGKLGGKWGPMSNHYGEPVHGAVLSSGGQASVVLEEMAPGTCLSLREVADGPWLVFNAAPGVWRGASRLYLDSRSTLIPIDEATDIEITRIGLLPTRANVDGLVVSRRTAHGMRIDGKPWTMVTFHLWDGHHTIESVVFGWGMTETFSDISVGDRILLTGGELGWRAGLPQLRVSPRGTRIEVRDRDWNPSEELPDSVR